MAKNATGPGHESIGSSASPESNQGHPKLSEAPKSATKHDYIVEGAQEAPSLEGIVDLTNTEDTEVTTRILPGNYDSIALYIKLSVFNTNRPAKLRCYTSVLLIQLSTCHSVSSLNVLSDVLLAFLLLH